MAEKKKYLIEWNNFQTEKFSINPSPFKHTNLWITKTDGEGTEISPEKLDEWLEKMFNEVM